MRVALKRSDVHILDVDYFMILKCIRLMNVNEKELVPASTYSTWQDTSEAVMEVFACDLYLIFRYKQKD